MPPSSHDAGLACGACTREAALARWNPAAHTKTPVAGRHRGLVGWEPELVLAAGAHQLLSRERRETCEDDLRDRVRLRCRADLLILLAIIKKEYADADGMAPALLA